MREVGYRTQLRSILNQAYLKNLNPILQLIRYVLRSRYPNDFVKVCALKVISYSLNSFFHPEFVTFMKFGNSVE